VTGLRACKYNLARSKNKQANFGVLHMVYQAWKGVWIEVAKGCVVTLKQRFKSDFEVHRAGSNHVLNLKFSQLYFLADIALDGLGVHLGSFFAELFTLGASDDHLSGFENQGRSTCWFLHSHDNSSESPGIVLRISTLYCYFLEV